MEKVGESGRGLKKVEASLEKVGEEGIRLKKVEEG